MKSFDFFGADAPVQNTDKGGSVNIWLTQFDVKSSLENGENVCCFVLQL